MTVLVILMSNLLVNVERKNVEELQAGVMHNAL